jgi:hypothetical protein
LWGLGKKATSINNEYAAYGNPKGLSAVPEKIRSCGRRFSWEVSEMAVSMSVSVKGAAAVIAWLSKREERCRTDYQVHGDY